MGLVQIIKSKIQPYSPAKTFLIVFNGESNSGGYAVNADATTYERTARSSVQKIDEYTFVFESCQVGVNNKQDHAGHTDNAEHGWELGLANNVEAGTFVGKSQIHLVKTGQGGSLIANWNVGGTYFNKLTSRYNAAKSILVSEGKIHKPIIWYTQGINDAIAGTNASTWKAATIAHFTQLRNLMGIDTPILFAQMMVGTLGENYNTQINEIISEVPNCYLISSASATLRDTNHWDYSGMKLLADRFSYKTEELLNIPL